MIEFVIKDYLEQHINAPVYLVADKNMPSRYVIVERTAGSMDNHVKRATVAIQSYAGTMYDTVTLNEEVKDVMLGMIEMDEISAVNLNSDYNFTDTSTHEYRYQAVFDIVHFI